MTNAQDELTLTLQVRGRQVVASGVVALDLGLPSGRELPPWAPGAHIDLLLGPGLTRQYSLCGNPGDRGSWRVAVLREVHGRGGSARVHDELREGAIVDVRGPRNHFALESSPRYVFIAGGIGITPILPMVGVAQKAGADWELHYGGRSLDSMAFTGELEGEGSPAVSLWPQDELGLLDLEAILGTPRSDTLIYCCGPEPLLRAVEQRCAAWPSGALHVERFAPRVDLDQLPSEGFEVELAQSSMTLTVPPGRSILDVVRDAGVDVSSSCQEGTCGTCETRIIEGEADHRDSLLSPEEQAANESMFICVSRSACPRLVLEL